MSLVFLILAVTLSLADIKTGVDSSIGVDLINKAVEFFTGGGGNLTGVGTPGELAVWDNTTNLGSVDYSNWDTNVSNDITFTQINTSIDVKIDEFNTSINDSLLPPCAEGKIVKRIGGVWVCSTDQVGVGDSYSILNYTKTVEDNKITLVFRT